MMTRKLERFLTALFILFSYLGFVALLCLLLLFADHSIDLTYLDEIGQ